MRKKILVVLGATNSSSGELSNTALERLNACYQLFSKECFVLCTGGWGDHFNTTKNSHAFYAKKYLQAKGILNSAFLPYALSNNTVEDAVKINEIIQNVTYKKLIIISSDYHLERVQLIFNTILKDVEIEYLGIKNTLPVEEFKKVTKHEKAAIKGIKNNGLYY